MVDILSKVEKVADIDFQTICCQYKDFKAFPLKNSKFKEQYGHATQTDSMCRHFCLFYLCILNTIQSSESKVIEPNHTMWNVSKGI